MTSGSSLNLKQTAAGLIPSDWGVTTIGDEFEVSAGGDWDSLNSSKFQDDVHRYPVLANSVARFGIQGYCRYYTIPGNSLTIVGRGVGVGHAIYRPDPFVPIVRLLALVPKRGSSAQFFAAYFNHRVSFSHESTGVPQLTAPQVRPHIIPLPPIDEQYSIAATLNDADKLITTLERLISKKQAIKQGMMQQLLTGRLRLPDFTRTWKLRKVGDFATVTAGGTPSTSVPRYWGGAVRWMSSGELHKKRVSEVAGRITEAGLRESSAQFLPAGSVLIGLAGQGKTRGTVAISRIKLTTNQSIAGILPSSEHSSDFLYYNLDGRYDELRAMSTGVGGRGGLNLTIIRSIPILMPDIREQRAIAAVLADVDDELDALSARLQKAEAVKQGMMQELLTGRTRLATAEAVA
jgi:type I restriction enzyme S subunit